MQSKSSGQESTKQIWHHGITKHPLSFTLRSRPKYLKSEIHHGEGKLRSAFHPNSNGNVGPKIFFAVSPLWSWLLTLLSSVRWARVESSWWPLQTCRQQAESGSWIFELLGWMVGGWMDSRSDLRGRNALYIGHIEGAYTHVELSSITLNSFTTNHRYRCIYFFAFTFIYILFLE